MIVDCSTGPVSTERAFVPPLKQDAAFALCAPSNADQQVSEVSGCDRVVAIHAIRADALMSL